MSKYAVLCEHEEKIRMVNFELFHEFTGWPGATDVFQVMIQHDINTLWVAPGHYNVPVESPGRDMFLADINGWDFKTYDDEEFLTSCHGYHKLGRYGSAERQMRSIIWPQHSSWRWKPEETDPGNFLMSIGQMMETLSGLLASSPAMTGRRLYLRHLEQKHKENWLAPQPQALLECYPWQQAGKDAIWKRWLGKIMTEAELRATQHNLTVKHLYIHAVDKNSSYLSGSQSLAIGIGEPEKFSTINGDHWQAEKHNKPGLWHIWAQRPLDCLYDGVEGPAPLYGSETNDNLQEWVTTPLLNMLQKQGWGIQIYEGIYWPLSRRIFEDFAPILWSMRQSFHRAMDMSPENRCFTLDYTAMKQIIVSFFGMFSSEKNRDRQYLRRDIWSSVVEAAKCAIYYNIEKIQKETGAWPAAVYTDCLVYVSQEADVKKALGSIMDRPEELGGYKLKWSLPVDANVLHALGQNEASDMMHLLNELARQQEAVV